MFWVAYSFFVKTIHYLITSPLAIITANGLTKNAAQLFCQTPWPMYFLIRPTISSLGSMMMMRFWFSFWK